jgi:RHS repeat-associated protein
MEEVDPNGNVLARYSQGLNIDEPLAMLRGSTSYYQSDGLGSVTSLSNAAGALAQTYTFDSFGKQTASSGSLTNPFRYSAREWDTETGLYYYRARYYDPSKGRFLSEDPITFGGGIDFYRYVRNLPTSFGDPFGLQDPVPMPGSSPAPSPSPTPSPTPVPGPQPRLPGFPFISMPKDHLPPANDPCLAQPFWWPCPGAPPTRHPPAPPVGWDKKPIPSPATTPPAGGKQCKKSDDDCKKIKEQCIDDCLDQLGKGGRWNQGTPFRNCIRRCLKSNGCEGYGNFW